RADSSPVVVGEGCPSSTLQSLGWPHRGYKGRSEECRTARAELLRRLAREEDWRIGRAARAAALDVAEGDALDALLLLAACRRMAAADHRAILREDPLARVEGW